MEPSPHDIHCICCTRSRALLSPYSNTSTGRTRMRNLSADRRSQNHSICRRALIISIACLCILPAPLAALPLAYVPTHPRRHYCGVYHKPVRLLSDRRRTIIHADGGEESGVALLYEKLKHFISSRPHTPRNPNESEAPPPPLHVPRTPFPSSISIPAARTAAAPPPPSPSPSLVTDEGEGGSKRSRAPRPTKKRGRRPRLADPSPSMVPRKISAQPLLTREQEYRLATVAQGWLQLSEARQQLATLLGHQPSAAEWRKSTGMSPGEWQAKMAEGKRAVQRLVRSNIRLVLSIANKYRGDNGVDHSDLVQEGTLGLLKAVQKYDPSRGFKFGTYATWWIQQGITRCLSNDSRPVKVPSHVQNLHSKYRKLRSKLERERGQEVPDTELAGLLKISTARLKNHIRLCQPQRSFEGETVGGVQLNGDALFFCEVLGDRTASSDPKAFAQQHNLQRVVTTALRQLNADERRFLVMRYGLDDGVAKTTREIADYAHVTIEYVRRTQVKALQRLRSADTYRVLELCVKGQSIADDLSNGEDPVTSDKSSKQDSPLDAPPIHKSPSKKRSVLAP